MLINSLLPIIVTLAGAYMMFCLRFNFYIHPIKTFKLIKNALKSKESRTSLSLALAGTLGVGNIVGVAVGISVGGAGCVFWLLVSSIFASALKYSETALTSELCDKSGGGMMYVIKKSFVNLGGKLSQVYAILCILLAFFMGSALQSASAAECVRQGSEFPEQVYCILFFVLLMFTVFKGTNGIVKFTSIAIPAFAFIYICLALSCIILNYNLIPRVTTEIFKSAFEFKSVGGGVFGFLSSKVISEGYSRGLLSNEAGAGTSSLAHARNNVENPITVGTLGMCEVVFDTVILCVLTAFSILLSVPNFESYDSGVALVMDSIGAIFGRLSAELVFLSVSVFAFSTVVCWFYYGNECLKFLNLTKLYKIYCIMFLLSVIFGFFVNVELVVRASDFILLALTILSVAAIIKNSDRIKALSEKYNF